MAEHDADGGDNILVGAALLQEPGQATFIGADEIVLVRGREHGEIRVECGEFAVDLQDVMEDVTWCYLSVTKALLIGSHTGSTAYVVDVGTRGILHQLALRRADEEHLLKLAFIPTPDKRRVLLLCEERVIGFALDGTILLNREIRATDQFLEVSDVGIGLRGIEHEELIYFAFPLQSEDAFALDRIVLAPGRQQSTGAVPIRMQGATPTGLPDAVFRETAVFEIAWTSADEWAGQAPPNVLGIALNDITEMFIRTQFGIFPTYPARAFLLLTLSGWMYAIIRLIDDTAEAPHATLYLGASSLYRVDISVRGQTWYLRFTRRYIPTDLDLLPPIVMAVGRFEAALFQVCERVQGFIEASGVHTAETRGFTTAFSRFRERLGKV